MSRKGAKRAPALSESRVVSLVAEDASLASTSWDASALDVLRRQGELAVMGEWQVPVEGGRSLRGDWRRMKEGGR